MKNNRHIPASLLPMFTFATMAAAIYMVFIYAPTEKTMGVVQRIFYFHVPSAWTTFLAFVMVFISSVAYLVRTDRKWDILASSSAEIGVLFCSLVLITGPIWAKPAWGIWWTWDARLTLTLVLWLIYVSYLMLRYYISNPEKRATLSAVLAIIGFIDVPLVYMAIRWWRTQHPRPVIAGGAGAGLAGPMWYTFIVCLVAFTLLYLYLLRKRAAIEHLRDELDALHKKMEEMKR